MTCFSNLALYIYMYFYMHTCTSTQAIKVFIVCHCVSLTESPLVVAVFWALLTSHSFFACGHTTTVTSLRVEAAFTGIHGEINKFNLPLAGLLVGLNTLGPQVQETSS